MQLRRVLRIARWEVGRNAVDADRKTLGLLAVGLLAGLFVGAAVMAGPAGVEAGIYRIGVAADDPYRAPAANEPLFAIREPSATAFGQGDLEIVVLEDRDRDPFEFAASRKGAAAQSEFRGAVASYNDRLMLSEPNESAAFPVTVVLTYAEQSAVAIELGSDQGPTSGADGNDTGQGTGTDGGSGGTGTGGGGQAGGAGGGIGGVFGGIAGGLGGGGGAAGTPADISPPFPFQSLVLAFLFVVPLNFVIQAYGSSMLSERLNRRGELLLVAPVSRADVILGKTLPYLVGAVGVVTAITAVLRFGGIAPSGGLVAVLAMIPLVGLFLGATFCAAMVARSFKELTFVTVTITVSLTSFAFVPAIFTDVHPIALISPLTLVVRDLGGTPIAPGGFVFATAPATLSALVLFGLGAGLYREEDLFTQRPIPLKVLDAFAGRIHGQWSALKLSALLLPFTFVAELVAVAFLFLLQQVGVVLVLLAVVVVEEVAKSIHVYAGYEHGTYDRSIRSAVVIGALSGLGFFLAEKFVAIAQLVQFDTIPAGRAALVTGLVPEGVPVLGLLALLLLAPLALHVLTAVVSSLGARRGKRPYLLALVAAMAIHFAYNYGVVMLLGI